MFKKALDEGHGDIHLSLEEDEIRSFRDLKVEKALEKNGDAMILDS